MKGRNKTVKLSLLTDNMIMYVENPKDYKLLKLNTVSRYKVNIHKSIVIVYAGL